MKYNKKNIKTLFLGEKKLKSSQVDNQLHSSNIDDDLIVTNNKIRFEGLRSNNVPGNQEVCASNVNLREKQQLRDKNFCKISNKRLSRSYDNIYFDYSKKSKLPINSS